jgi:ferredoxin--NADP+ reductase
LRARPTGQEELIEASVVVRAIGYTGVGLPGVPFDQDSGTIPNVRGRVTGEQGAVPGIYTAGWIKRGPSGVIGTNKKCAQETVDSVLQDDAAGALTANRGLPRDEVLELIRARQPALVDYANWESIDAHERGLGEPNGRPRVKLTRVDELLAAARGA